MAQLRAASSGFPRPLMLDLSRLIGTAGRSHRAGWRSAAVLRIDATVIGAITQRGEPCTSDPAASVWQKAGPRNLIEILRKHSLPARGSGHAEPRNAAQGAAAMVASAVFGSRVARCVYRAGAGSITIQ